MPRNSKVYDVLETYLKELDRVPLSPDSIFELDGAKERYESLLMFAFQRYQAAWYHYNNVIKFIADESARLEEKADLFDEKIGKNLQVIRAESRSSLSDDRYFYELTAFLEALKSSLDFIATVCAKHLKGVQADSISTLMKLVKKGKKGPILNEVSKHLDWLRNLRSYRHHLVHRLGLRFSSDSEVHKVAGEVTSIKHPITIPRATPSYIPFTRRARMTQEGLLCLVYEQHETTVTDEQGNEKVTKLSLHSYPAQGYVAIEDFMDLHLENYENFFVDTIGAMQKLNFRSCSFI